MGVGGEGVTLKVVAEMLSRQRNPRKEMAVPQMHERRSSPSEIQGVKRERGGHVLSARDLTTGRM